MSANDPFAVVPFKLPEQFRAFAEMGVFQARDGYQMFKDAAVQQWSAGGRLRIGHQGRQRPHHNGNRHGPDQYCGRFCIYPEPDGGRNRMPEAFELMNAHARKQFEVLSTQTAGPCHADPQGGDRNRRTAHDERRKGL